VDQGFGIAVKHIRDFPQAIIRLLDPAIYAEIRRRIGTVSNRAVFEVPDIIEQISRQLGLSQERSSRLYELAAADTYRRDTPAASMRTEIAPWRRDKSDDLTAARSRTED